MIELEPHWWTLSILAAVMAGLHLFMPAIDRQLRRHEDMGMGLIGGVAAGYVLLYLLPKIAGMNDALAQSSIHHRLTLYYVLLAAIVVYLITMHLERSQSPAAWLARYFDFLIHGTYSLLVGYVFVELSTGSIGADTLIAVILGLHLIGMTHLLRAGRTITFDRSLRWVFSLLILSGTVVGLVTELPKPALNTITAFLAGIILVNVIAEELPIREHRRVPWFLVGVAFYLTATSLIISSANA